MSPLIVAILGAAGLYGLSRLSSNEPIFGQMTPNRAGVKRKGRSKKQLKKAYAKQGKLKKGHSHCRLRVSWTKDSGKAVARKIGKLWASRGYQAGDNSEMSFGGDQVYEGRCGPATQMLAMAHSMYGKEMRKHGVKVSMKAASR